MLIGGTHVEQGALGLQDAPRCSFYLCVDVQNHRLQDLGFLKLIWFNHFLIQIRKLRLKWVSF